LAEKEFFIFFAALLQKFNFKHAPGTTLPSYIDIFPERSLLRTAPNFEVVITTRF
jgi:hypothetical protein